MDFVAVDVETANSDPRSICQIGIAGFHQGKLIERWQSLVDPRDRFDAGNMAVHGIRAAAVRGAPTFGEVYPELQMRFGGRIVASHTPFDRRAICGAAEAMGLPHPECRWLDTAKVVRRTWPEFSKKGYGLANLTRAFGIAFQHHDALEDARAAGEILVRALNESGRSVEEWLQETTQVASGPAKFAANPAGALFGTSVVLCKDLSTPRREAARLAAEAGCEVLSGLRRGISLLVIAAREPSSPTSNNGLLRRAEEMIRQGQPLRIVGEAEFFRLTKRASPSGGAASLSE
jgi:DNA polymerase-3 subunit epsilon